MAKMKAVQVPKPGADFEIVEREIPQPGTGQVRIRVQACGICHSDSVVKENLLPGITYPRVPGHEVAGVIDEVGGGVTTWKKGQRVGVGWHGGQDGTCLACRRGDFTNCANLRVCGISYDGGYQEFMVAPIDLRLPHRQRRSLNLRADRDGAVRDHIQRAFFHEIGVRFDRAGGPVVHEGS
jgi:D-arabinose 1-dehydrogenase-like Zn-dependent alcohol dehydrogenase